MHRGGSTGGHEANGGGTDIIMNFDEKLKSWFVDADIIIINLLLCHICTFPRIYLIARFITNHQVMS